MILKNISLSKLKPYENNPRLNDDAVPKVAESIKRFGFRVPLVIDAQNVIVAGHTRYKAAQQLGLEKVPCVVADDLSPEQIRAYRLADNKVAEIAQWDFSALQDELEALLDFDMQEFGFADIELHSDSLDGFFAEPDSQAGGDSPKTITCPHCGEVFTP